jgi:hypothetical protein
MEETRKKLERIQLDAERMRLEDLWRMNQLDVLNLDLDNLKKREAYIVMEFYRVAKDAMTISRFDETKTAVEAIIPEMPLDGDKKADLVVFTKAEYAGSRKVLLVVECKQ